jgi:kynurenine formamidase
VVDVTGLAPRTPITWEHLAPAADAFGPGVIVLLRTGWDVHRASDTYFTHPFLDGGACARLLDLGVRTIGIDAINIDETPAGDLDLERFRCHAQISAAGGVIVENLAGLDAIDFPAPVISVLPLRLAGGDGAPARAVAIEGLA